jgi:hypothetical protein
LGVGDVIGQSVRATGRQHGGREDIRKRCGQ